MYKLCRPSSDSNPLKRIKSKNRVGLYARISTPDQKTHSPQLAEMRKYVKNRGWTVLLEEKGIGAGASSGPKREEVMTAARRSEVDTVIVWKLDRWGRSVVDLVTTLKELGDLGVRFIALSEALNLTTLTGRAMTDRLAVFAEFERDILKERVKAGIAQAKSEGRVFGRPKTAALKSLEVRRLKKQASIRRALEN